MMDYKKSILDIIVVDGQSNAEGNGLSTDDTVEVRSDVFELIDFNNYWMEIPDPKNPILRMTLPVQCKVQCLQEAYRGPLPASHLSFGFVDEYIKAGLLKEGHKIMVVKTAVGGTGFALNQQGIHDILHPRTLDMIDLALSFNPENRIVAFLWHQGEHDAFENKDLNDEERYNFYKEKFMEKMNDIKTRYETSKFPIIAGEFCNEWSDKPENASKVKVIERCLKDCVETLGGAMVSSEGLLSNNQEIGNGDDIHFSKKSLKELGKRYFEAYNNLRNK